MKRCWAIAALMGLATAMVAVADQVPIVLGTSNENVLETGLGGDGYGNGYITFTLGSCSGATCTLSGDYTGSVPGYTSGTYSLITTYPGGTVVPLQGEVPNAAGGGDEFTVISAAATIQLDLNETGGPSYTIPIFDGSNFLNAIGIQYANATCTGTNNCGVGGISLVDGATITGQVTGSAQFSVSAGSANPPPSAAAPEPCSMLLCGSGLLAAAGLLRKRSKLA